MIRWWWVCCWSCCDEAKVDHAVNVLDKELQADIYASGLIQCISAHAFCLIRCNRSLDGWGVIFCFGAAIIRASCNFLRYEILHSSRILGRIWVLINARYDTEGTPFAHTPIHHFIQSIALVYWTESIFIKFNNNNVVLSKQLWALISFQYFVHNELDIIYNLWGINMI